MSATGSTAGHVNRSVLPGITWCWEALWAEPAACSPGAHVLIATIALAAHAHALALRRDACCVVGGRSHVRQSNRLLTVDDFFRTFPVQPLTTRARVSGALARFGF